ncbi:MAG TPA: hypothetical protein VKE73_11445, partial [Myxococcota bacterium]|nr:hypothetical protein [Myxococcota bacterium]
VGGTLEGGESPKLLVREVFELAGAEEKLSSQLRLHITAAEATRDRLTALRDLLAANPGPCAVQLHLLIPGESETVLSFGSGVRPCEALLGDLDGLFGRRVTELCV